ncbi:MAG: hypothetical protein CL549_15670 [Alcanivorax sp.]|nr:hypothetical protein [Alcanivorax sp.]MAY11897.1 hypothetical protein [Alcanivorax sp.]MBI56787.1 hypothetical protein [Alcanivorax sp.]MBM1145654.1 hypothetical protein [Alcanivorax sp. ZXX171]|tara:strand:+ start:393 stop:1103 length:711 start_codon:yes stop_codon:yes gene_type:complete
MSFGLFVRNDDAQVQIDANYSNMGLVQQGIVQPDVWHTGGAASSWWSFLTVTGLGAPVMALRAEPGARVNLRGIINNGGGSFTFVIVSLVENAEVEYFVFDPLEYHTMSSNRYGLLVNDAGGVKRYDSRFRMLRLLDFLSYSDILDQDSRSYSGKKVAIIFAQTARRYYGFIVGSQPAVNGYVFDFSMMVETPTLGGIEVGQAPTWGVFIRDPGSFVFPNTILSTTLLLVIDVTGF